MKIVKDNITDTTVNKYAEKYDLKPSEIWAFIQADNSSLLEGFIHILNNNINQQTSNLIKATEIIEIYRLQGGINTLNRVKGIISDLLPKQEE